jgi:hypothetical protein
MERRVVRLKFTVVSDGGSKHPCNVDKLVPHNMAPSYLFSFKKIM